LRSKSGSETFPPLPPQPNPFLASHLQKVIDNYLTLAVTYFVRSTLQVAVSFPLPNPAARRLSFSSLAKNFCNSFRMRTCKSVSKQRISTSFGMNTYKKQGGGGVSPLPTVPVPRFRAHHLLIPLLVGPLISPNPTGMNTSEKSPFNSFRMRTSKIIGLKVLQNEHFQKKRGGGGGLVRLTKNLFSPFLPSLHAQTTICRANHRRGMC
jgi:hypothetical protein